MKKSIFLIYCSFLLYHLKAQDCDVNAIMNVKGKWTTTSDNIVSPDKTFPSSQYSQLRTRLDKIALLFKEAYPEPAGMEAKWYRSIRGSSLVDKGPVPYQFNSLYSGWYCNQNLHKLMLGTETGTWAFVFVNDLHWFLNDQYDQVWVKINGVTAYLLPKIKEQWNGMPVYETSAGGQRSKALLLTTNDRQPYKAVSRLSYMEAVKQKIEADKQEQMDLFKKMPDNTAKDQKEENRQKMAKYFDDKISVINDLSKNYSADELQQPAIIDNVSNFKYFSTLEKGGRMIVAIDPDYFNLKLPRYIPQVIMLFWQWDNSSAALNFKKQVEENFPIDKLKALLDK